MITNGYDLVHCLSIPNSIISFIFLYIQLFAMFLNVNKMWWAMIMTPFYHFAKYPFWSIMYFALFCVRLFCILVVGIGKSPRATGVLDSILATSVLVESTNFKTKKRVFVFLKYILYFHSYYCDLFSDIWQQVTYIWEMVSAPHLNCFVMVHFLIINFLYLLQVWNWFRFCCRWWKPR